MAKKYRCTSFTVCVALVALGIALSFGCVGQPDPYYDPGTTTPDGAPVEGQPDANNPPPPPGPDGGVTPTPDAYVPPPPPDAYVPPVQYPPGPYGTNEGSVIANLTWTGYIDTDADGDSDPFNESPTTIKLEDFYVGFDPGARIIMINSSAGWCGACQDEAPSLVQLNTSHGPRGARFITALFEDTNSWPADTNFAKTWGEWYDLTFPTVADPDDLLGPYYEDSTVPMNILIDASDMTIIDIHHGFDYYYTKQILDNYCD
jgi:thiol-disulfide isomerase/thioredoxin